MMNVVGINPQAPWSPGCRALGIFLGYLFQTVRIDVGGAHWLIDIRCQIFFSSFTILGTPKLLDFFSSCHQKFRLQELSGRLAPFVATQVGPTITGTRFSITEGLGARWFLELFGARSMSTEQQQRLLPGNPSGNMRIWRARCWSTPWS